MDLMNLKMNEFISLLGSDAPAPGGGAAAAVAGSIGIALCRMVVALTKGREKYQEHEALMAEIQQAADKLEAQIMATADRDAEAYSAVIAAYKLPKDAPERGEAIEQALKTAAEVPFELMSLSYEAAKLSQRAYGKSNRNAEGDLGVSVILLKAALQSGWLNVLANLKLIKDAQFAAQYRQDGGRLLDEMEALSDEVLLQLMGE